MSTPIHLEVPPSAVFLYSPRPCDSLKPPLSPTSSVKGCFVRSRPTSAVFSEYQFNEFPGMSGSNGSPSPITSEDESGLSSPAIDAVVCAAERRANFGQSDARSLAPSTCSRMRIVRRSDADLDKEMEMLRKKLEIRAQGNKGDTKVGDEVVIDQSATGAGARRHTWPSYKAIRKTVSSVLHRKEARFGSVSQKAGDIATQGDPDPPVNRLKSSSASLFIRRRKTVSSGGDKAKATQSGQRARANTDGAQIHAPLRRSGPFSGFTNALGVINDDDDDLDEATTEARGLVEVIRRRWAFEEVPEEDSGSPIRFDMEVFERYDE
ncbi:hypothetical protein Hypma_013402 [Hypsizygus marmoreus]|uniref:Uncharacterized protein n=1 Tax=Hypsizygus marmoreus TaxID=39966 RepID=A0A369JKN0_HYPMA|nr:hypothetical protein Hypma_013402 [Hypsizygus marmoreus]